MNPLKKKFFQYVIPSIVGMWVFSFYTIIDGFFVAHYVGETALSAVNISMPFITTVFAVSVLFSTGSSTLIAMKLGAGDYKSANNLFNSNSFILAAISIVSTIFFIIFLDSLVDFLGAGGNNREFVKKYLGIIILFQFFYVTSYNFETIAKVDGFPRLATIGVGLSAIANIVLDYLFVGVFSWGIEGAAWATGIAQLFSTTLFIVHFRSKKSKLKLTQFKLDFKIYKKLIPIGMADSISEASVGIVIFLYNKTLLRVLGEFAIVTFSVISYINIFITMTMLGVIQGMQPLVSFYYGKRDNDSCKKLLKYSVVSLVLLSTVVYAITNVFIEELLGIFLKGETTSIEYSKRAFRLFSSSFLIVGFNLLFCGFFAAIGKSSYAITIAFLKSVFFIWIALECTYRIFGPEYVWLSSLFSESICLFIALIMLKLNMKQFNTK